MLLAAEDLESIEATLELLADIRAQERIAAAEADFAAGDVSEPGPTRVTYRVKVARTAARQLTEHLPEAVAAACVEFLYGPLAENPRRVGVRCASPSRATGALAAANTAFVMPSMRPLARSGSSTSATGGMPTIDHDVAASPHPEFLIPMFVAMVLVSHQSTIANAKWALSAAYSRRHSPTIQSPAAQ